ncbi:MAG TPA: hypothetical protein VKV04_25330 [Verrucomicrobiae bacterium]|nr:hypothetical protein [Verrucomicrobiae bacterium]
MFEPAIVARAPLLAGQHKAVKEFNPFQVPGTAIGTIQIQHHRRERFRNVFFIVLAAHIALFLVLLIQGCRSGKDTATADSTPVATTHK